MTIRPAYFDPTGKPPDVPEKRQLESADPVRSAKFFGALGFTLEKQTTPDGRRYVLAKGRNIELGIFLARAPQPADVRSLTLIVADVAAAAALAEAAGGKIVSRIEESLGGKTCEIASPDGLRIVLADNARALKALGDSAAEAATAKSAVSLTTPPVVEAVAGKPVDDFSNVLEEVEAMTSSGGSADDQPVLTRSGRESLIDLVPPEFSPQLSAQLHAVRTACAIMLFGWLVPLVVGVLIVVSQIGKWPAADILTASSIVGLLGAVTLLIAKLFCVGKRSQVCGSRWVALAVALDIMGLLVGLILELVRREITMSSVELRFRILYVFCSLAAPIVFTIYLARVAREVQDKTLASLARSGIFCALVFAGVLVAVYFVETRMNTSGSGTNADIALALWGVLIASGFIDFLLHIALLIGFVSRSFKVPARA